jgi:hypothetical protein
MTDESRIDEEYEPTDIDPDDPISTLPGVGAEPPVEADRADWVDQHRDVPEDLDDEAGRG